MNESEDNMSSEDMGNVDSPTTVKPKPKKRSLVERELETNMTARVTSPATIGDGTSLSRYGRARRLKNELESTDPKKFVSEVSKSPLADRSPSKTHSTAYKMHASNSPCKTESTKVAVSEEKYLDNQIESIYQENISLSRFGSEEVISSSPAKKFPKVYIRKDLIQRREPEETIMLIKNIFSPDKSSASKKAANSQLNKIMVGSSEKYSVDSSDTPNGYIDNSSVVKTLDFGNKKRKRDNKDTKMYLSKSDLFELEAKCQYQVGDLAWARMGTYPFWPCIITRDPSSGLFVKKKLFGRVEHDVLHVTFFGDNGRRSWIVDNMLRKYLGQLEFESTREAFTLEDKKKDPRLYAAFFISEKKLPFWNISVEEAETFLREPKRLRIDLLNDLLQKSRNVKTTPKQLKSGKITRTDSDVSLSESLYDSLFSEDDGKAEEADRSRAKSKNKSLDVSQVVTACLDNMAAKTGITMIQRQSHMDRWLQKAKSKTPEKIQMKNPVSLKDDKSSSKKKKTSSKVPVQKPYSFRYSPTESLTNLLPYQNEHDYSKYQNEENNPAITNEIDLTDDNGKFNSDNPSSGIGIIAKVESLYSQKEEKTEPTELITTVLNDDFVSPEKGESEETEHHNDNEVNEQQQDSAFASDSAHEMEEDGQKSMNMETNKSNNETIELNADDVGTNCSNILQIEKLNYEDKDDVDSKGPTNEEKIELFLKDDTNLIDSVQIEIEQCADEKYNNKHVDDVDILSSVDRINKNSDIDVISAVDKTLSQKKADIQMAGPNDMSIDNSYDSSDNINEVKLNRQADDTKFQQTGELPVDNTMKNILLDKEHALNSEGDTIMKKSSYFEQDKALAYNHVIEEGQQEADDKESADDLDYESDEFDYKLEYSPLTNDEKSDNDEDDNLKVKGNKYVKKINSVVLNNKIDDEKTKVPPSKSSELTSIEDDDDEDTTLKEVDSLPEPIKENGVHSDEEAPNQINKETVSINTEDSQPRTRSKAKNEILLGKSSSKSELNNQDSEFQKYLHLRQDEVMDEHPGLSEEEIVAYLFKTWQYEESKKSDVKKADDIHQSGLVKGLGKDTLKKKTSLSLKNKNIKKKDKNLSDDDTDTVSINSEDSGSSLIVRRNHSRRIISPLDDNDCVDGSPKTNTKVERNIETVLINSELSETLEKQKRYKRIKTPFEVSQRHESANARLEKITINHSELELVSLVSDDDEPLSKHIPSRVKSPVSIKHDNKIHEVKTPEPKSSSIYSEENYQSITPNSEVNKYNQEITDLAETESSDSEGSEVPLSRRKLRSKPNSNVFCEEKQIKDDVDADTTSINSEHSDISLNRRKQRSKNEKKLDKVLEDPEFTQYLELRQDALMDENPQLTQDEIINYLFKTWLYEENSKNELKKVDDIEQSGLVKGLSQETLPKKVKKRVKVEKETLDDYIMREKPKRKVIQPYYNEDFSDLEDDIKVFEIFKKKGKLSQPISIEIKESNSLNVDNEIKEDKETKEANEFKEGNGIKNGNEFKEYAGAEVPQEYMEEEFDEVELYFEQLTRPKPNLFKGLVREKVCEICELTGNLVKCKGCNCMFHIECIKKKVEVADVPAPTRGRKKKKKQGRKMKSLEDSESQSDDKSRDLSEENNESIEETVESVTCTVDAESFESQLEAKMKEMLGDTDTVHYDSYSSDDGLTWTDTIAGKCEIVDVKLKRKTESSEYSDFKCNHCLKQDTPLCFVCKSAVSKTSVELRQRCHVAHCHKYYHLECLDQWPQTHFNGGEPSKNNKKINEFFEALTCPRHVCHTCVSDDPRGCKTRFSGDKLARCVRCPATYHAFTKCLPAGTKILTGSHIICPRHYEHRPGKVPCHVNTGWCFICALGGTLICCEYCPTSFHAECLNIKPPEGGYMCEDCETGRLPLYGEMVWVKLGHYRWWPGIILHPCEIPANIMAVKHSPGEFVVRFFGQYDHYWVNRGRVFPFQEGDSGRISSQKSKIDAAFTTAMEHAQRACEILKSAQPNEEESLDIASSLLPPHYVKLKVNKPCGAVARRGDDPEGSLTQCECSARDDDPCGPYSHCLNRMLLTECGPMCRAGERCNNRAFEKRLYPKLVPYRTPQRGWGLKTLDDIKAGQFVIEYVGELIDEEEFRRRMNRKHEIRDENFYFLTLDKERMIDAGPKGNLARFMNHCCEPNCETQKWTVLGDVRVGLFALYDIPANSEVTFNYNLECAGIDKKRCLCGAKRCSGYMGAKPKQEESQSKKGKLAAKRTYKKRKPEESPSISKNKPAKRLGRPPKPRELTEIEKDLLIIRNATNGVSSDDARLSSTDSERNPKALKRKRISFSQEEAVNSEESPSMKKQKCESDLVSA